MSTVKRKVVGWVRLAGLAVLMSYAGAVSAVATCTSVATGVWDTASTWSCVGTPIVTVPDATTPVVLASPYTVTLNGSVTVPSITINSGATLSDTNGNVLTVTGNITNNGTYTSSNNGGIASTGAAASISGSGTFANQVRFFISGSAPTIAAGSVLAFTGTSQIRTGRTSGGSTVATSVLTINGTLNGSGQTGGTGTPWMRLYASNTIVGSTGVLTTTGTATIQYRATGTLTNNGSVTIGTVNVNTGTGTWTNAANSSLTVRTLISPSVLNASASGNTVTYNSPATPITPSSNTYYNLAGTGVICPVSYIILGTSPCVASLFVQGSPTNCTNVTGVGTIAWATPANAYTSNNIYATASNVNRSTTTNYLNCTGFSLNAPAGATIIGITVYVERKTDSGTTLKDAFVYLIKGGAISTALNGATATIYPTVDTTEAHGGQTNLWGTTWTVTDVNAANFGVAFAAQNTSTTLTTNRTITVDQIQIRVDYTLPALHHIRIEHDGAASTCATEPITLKACSNAACTTYYTGGDVTGIGLSPTGGSYTWTPGSTVSITGAGGGINSGILLADTAAGTAALVVTGSPSPTPGNAYECYNTATGASGGAGSGACNLVFSSDTFSFNVPDHTAATRQSVTMTSCTSNFANQTRSVKLWSTYVNPATGTLQGKVVAGTGNADCATGYANLGTASGSPTSLILAFGPGVSPQAIFSFCYPDVGSVRVDARYDGSAATGDSGVVILGNDNFITKPDHFALSAIKCTSTSVANCGAGARAMPTPGDNPAAADATGGAFMAAGSSADTQAKFTATVTAKNALNATTPNYGLESSSEGVKLTVNSPIVAPSGGAIGLLTCKASTTGCIVPGGSANFSNGAATVTDLAWNEAGVIQLMMKTSDGNYLGTGEVATPTPSGNIGRFFPHHFDVAPDAALPIENRSDICDGGVLVADGVTACTSPAYNYLGEEMSAQFKLTARTVGGATTQNYISSTTASQNFAKLNPAASGNPLHFGAVDAVVPTYLTSRLDTSVNANGSFTVGVADIVAPVAITRGSVPNGPYAPLSIGIAPVDSDGVAMGAFDLDTDATAGNDHTLIGDTEVRFGRMKLSNAYGSGLLQLPVPLVMQYWNGSAFVTNTQDNETRISVANIGMTNYKGNLAAGETTATLGSVFNAGVGSLTLSAPGATNNGSVDLFINLGSAGAPANCPVLSEVGSTSAAMPYLSGKWCGNVYDRDPTAHATFGIYRTPIIYMRENY